MEKVQLGALVKITSGFAFKSNLFNTDKNGLPLIRIRDVVRGYSDTYYDGEYKAEYLIQKGDALIGMDGEFNLALWNSGKALLNQRVCKIQSIDERLDQNYLIRFLPKALKDIEDKTPFVTVKHLSVKDINNIQIPLPPLAEQRRIASILDQADELRQKRQLAIKKLDQLLQAEFISKFHQKNYPEFKVSNLLENDKSMRTGPFGSQLLHSEFVEEGIHVLGIDNAVQNSFNWAKPRFITEEKYKDLKRYTVKPKDVIITIMGTCGKCAVVPDDIPKAINTKHLCCITLDQNKCNPEFLHSYFLLHPTARNYLDSRAKGAIMSGLNMGIIKDLPVELPPIEMQNEFSILKQKIILQRSLMEKKLSKINDLFSSLQNQAFNGTL
ncbi:restriction endonuclease subunit S [Acinetobacter wuhouensis]|uniref:restriction endonuclease subunit S n=1 Tax=Acinetobacter wuhouensis TaxID=1879050 RepID=UPI00102334C0|nr:restriction endonuclease subunit S [Acinetobacter wuhouensis]RZG73795.1 restriction endonuclease subunit S [Acinetobacter wuhouensis]